MLAIILMALGTVSCIDIPTLFGQCNICRRLWHHRLVRKVKNQADLLLRAKHLDKALLDFRVATATIHELAHPLQKVRGMLPGQIGHLGFDTVPTVTMGGELHGSL